MNLTSSIRLLAPFKTDPLRPAVWAVFFVAALGGLLHLAGHELLSAAPEGLILCPLRAVTGLLCPGCGMIHAFLAMGRLDFAGAWAANPFSFPLAALMALYLAGRVPRAVRTAAARNLALAAVLAFWAARLSAQLR